jgi:hypothetical protein
MPASDTSGKSIKTLEHTATIEDCDSLKAESIKGYQRHHTKEEKEDPYWGYTICVVNRICHNEHRTMQ